MNIEMRAKKTRTIATAVTASILAVAVGIFSGLSDMKCAAAPKNTAAVKKVAYLTFDDGPSRITPRLLAELKQYKVKATFFVIAGSENTPKRRAWMKQEVEAGHTIAIHSWSHKYEYIYKSESNFLTDLKKIKAMIVQATGIEPKFMRFPGGTDNTISFKYHHYTPIMPTLLNDIESQGITAVDWNAGGDDAVYPVPSTRTIVNDVIGECRYEKKAIILLHDSSPHSSSVAAVPEIITRLRAMGFTFEPLTSSSQAFHHRPAKRR